MSIISQQTIAEQVITVTLTDDRTRGTVQIQDEPVTVEVYPAGPPGSGGGDGVDAIARQKATQAQATASQAVASLVDHQNSSQPHKAYDQDIPSLSLIFQNGLI